MFLRWWTSFLLVAALLSGAYVLAPGPDSAVTAQETTVPIGGGTAMFWDSLETGDRFLQSVPAPDLTSPYWGTPDERPGDGKDPTGVLTGERRIADHEYHDRELTGGLIIQNVHGTAENPICVCDFTLILWNDTQSVLDVFRIIESSYVWVDNITVYTGGLLVMESTDITITDVTMIDGAGMLIDKSTDLRIHSNSIVRQRGPLTFYDHPQAMSECWPNEMLSCSFTGIYFSGGGQSLVDHNYIHGDGGITGTGDAYNNRLIHNSLYDGGALYVADYETEVGWNLVRGWSLAGIRITGHPTDNSPSWIHNNSVIFPYEIDTRGWGFAMTYGVWAIFCSCVMENNDLLGFGLLGNVSLQGSSVQSSALLTDLGAHVVANNNYWGTLHDPSLPPGWWIQSRRDGTYELDDWRTEPQHPYSLGPSAAPHEDIPYWYGRITEEEWPIQELT